MYDVRDKLTWHEGAIPTHQIWVKLGGDHEGHITPKLHLLESHTVPSARRFSVGLGLLAEHASKSIHACFNFLNRLPIDIWCQHSLSTMHCNQQPPPESASRQRNEAFAGENTRSLPLQVLALVTIIKLNFYLLRLSQFRLST